MYGILVDFEMFKLKYHPANKLFINETFPCEFKFKFSYLQTVRRRSHIFDFTILPLSALGIRRCSVVWVSVGQTSDLDLHLYVVRLNSGPRRASNPSRIQRCK